MRAPNVFVQTAKWSTVVLTVLTPSTSWGMNILLERGFVRGGNEISATLKLMPPRLPHALTVNLRSSSPSIASLPATVVVPAGELEAPFVIKTKGVATRIKVELSARHSGNPITEAESLTVLPAVVASVSMNPAFMGVAGPSQGTVALDGVAPAGGLTVQLRGSENSPFLPAVDHLTIPEGGRSGSFGVTATGRTTASIIARANDVEESGKLVVGPVGVARIEFDPDTVVSGADAMGKVILERPAPAGGLTVQLVQRQNSGPMPQPSSAVPQSVAFAAGQTAKALIVPTLQVSSPLPLTITASLNGTAVTQTVVVRPNGVAALTLDKEAVSAGGTVTATLTLDRVAPVGGMTVKLSVGPATTGVAVVSLPTSTLLVPQGVKTKTFSVVTSKVSVALDAWVRATLNGTAKTTSFKVTQ